MAQIESNTAFAAYPNAGAPSTLDVPYRGSADDHNAAVLTYLTGCGLPKDQVLSFGVGTTLESSGSGPLDPSAGAAGTKFLAYTTSVRRAIDGIRVVESLAAVEMNNSGDVVTETIYWPPIPAAVVAEAKSLASKLADPSAGANLRSWLTVAGADASRGEVVIHHAPAFAGATSSAVVSVDAYGGSGGSGAARHFDAQGKEFRLPHEAVSAAGAARP